MVWDNAPRWWEVKVVRKAAIVLVTLSGAWEQSLRSWESVENWRSHWKREEWVGYWTGGVFFWGGGHSWLSGDSGVAPFLFESKLSTRGWTCFFSRLFGWVRGLSIAQLWVPVCSCMAVPETPYKHRFALPLELVSRARSTEDALG